MAALKSELEACQDQSSHQNNVINAYQSHYAMKMLQMAINTNTRIFSPNEWYQQIQLAKKILQKTALFRNKINSILNKNPKSDKNSTTA